MLIEDIAIQLAIRVPLMIITGFIFSRFKHKPCTISYYGGMTIATIALI